MRNFRNLPFLALVATLAAPTYAQVPQTATGPIASDGFDDIIVTARRRAETLIDVPISVSAITGSSLEAQGAPDITALQRQTPNMTLEVARGSNTTLIAFIRGVGQQDPLWGFEPGVGLYVDDVYMARPQGAVLDVFDVERIEVLRGPQGTLYGRNTIGGAIKYVTRRLGHEVSGQVRAAYGSYNQVDLSGTIALPLTDTISVGGGLMWSRHDGYGKNLTTGVDQYDKDVVAGRLSIEFDNGPVFIRLSGDRTEDRSKPRHGTRLLGSGGMPGFEPTDSVYDTRAGIGDDNYVVTQGVGLTAEVEVSDAITLKSITSYRDGRTDTLIDFDNTAGPVLDVPAWYGDWQFTQEAQLLVETEKLQAVFGAYYLEGRASGAFDTVLGALNLTTLTSGNVKTKSIALFGDMSYSLTDQFKISAGLRWTRDDKTGTVFRRNYFGIRSPEFGNAAAIPDLIRSDYTNSRAFNKATPRVSLSYQPVDDINIYASWGRGFKSGGFDMRGDAILTPTTVDGYKPETIDSYEAGLKGAFLDRTLFLNLAGYYSKYKDQQVTVQRPDLGGGIASFVDNAGKARIWGVEAEARMVPTSNLSMQLMFGYTNAKYQEFFTYITGGTTPVDVSNERVFQNTPKLVVSSSLTWSMDVAGGRLSLTPAISHRSSLSMFEIPTPLLDQPGYVLIDASANWTSANERFTLGVHGRNLSNERYRVGGYNFPGALFGDSVIGYYGPPRTVTVSAGYNF